MSANADHGIQLFDILGDVTLTYTTLENNNSDFDSHGVGDGLNASAVTTSHSIGGNLTITGATIRDTDGPGTTVSQASGVYVTGLGGPQPFRTARAGR